MINRILLIDIEQSSKSNDVENLISSNWVHHPLGLMYLASACREHFPDIEIRIFHTFTAHNPIDHIKSLLTEFKPDLIGLRSLSVAQAFFKKIAETIRGIKPDIPLIAGGPYPSSSYKSSFPSLIDLVVIGEGEETFVDLVTRLREEGELPRDIYGTAVKENGTFKANPPRPPIKDLDSIPFPDNGLIDLKDYKGISNLSFQDSSECALIYSSRGCPYNCFYCHQLFGKKVRRRSAENLLAEMEDHVHTRGIRNFVFVDDIFNVPMDKAKEALELIIKRLPGIRLSFPNGLRADQLDHELIDLLEQAGTTHVAMAVETASPRLQKMIAKDLDLERAKEMIHAASKKIIICIYFMIGFPSETYGEAMETVNFARDLDHIAQPVLNVVRVYRGTLLFDILKPSDEQAEMLVSQEKEVFQPNLLNDLFFYGDIFPKEKVPLSGEDINELRWEWVRYVVRNKERAKNGHHILQKYLSRKQIILFYKNFFHNPSFNEKSLENFLDRMGRNPKSRS